MKTPHRIALKLQFTLCTLALYPDDWMYALNFIEDNGENDFEKKWQIGVYILHHLCEVELIWDGAAMKWSNRMPLPNSKDDLLNYVINLQKLRPPEAIEWVMRDFYATSKCIELVEKYDIYKYCHAPNDAQMTLCVPFVEEIEQMFVDKGVLWFCGDQLHEIKL